jgi:hypothetical protein
MRFIVYSLVKMWYCGTMNELLAELKHLLEWHEKIPEDKMTAAQTNAEADLRILLSKWATVTAAVTGRATITVRNQPTVTAVTVPKVDPLLAARQKNREKQKRWRDRQRLKKTSTTARR